MPLDTTSRPRSLETLRWSRMRGPHQSLTCVVASIRSGFHVQGYEVRLYHRGMLLYRSRLYTSRALANQDADQLLADIFTAA
jgi:hypothetical protein